MAARRESSSLDILVRTLADKKSFSDVSKQIAGLNKQVKAVEKQNAGVIKNTQQNLRQIQNLSKYTDTFAHNLSDATKTSVQKLKKLGDELQKASEEAEELKEAYAAAGSDAQKSDIAASFKATTARMAQANRAVEEFRKTNIKAAREVRNNMQAQEKARQKMVADSNYDAGKDFKDGIKRMFQGDLKGGAKQIGESAHGSLKKKAAEAQIDAAASGNSKAAGSAEAMSTAVTAIGAAGIAIAGFVKLLLAASDHMTTLNKALLQGNGLANEFGATSAQFTKAVDNMRGAAINAHGPLLKYGMDSEDAMKAAGSFAKEASGSMVRTEMQLRKMGGGDLDQGMFEFAKNASVYGKALGVETGEVATMMGRMVSEVGIGSENVQSTMGDIVKQAAQAGMPVTKFMGIFHEAIPNLDLFTNRIEELTGIMKMLSKTMDPRAVKGFMSAFGKGMDQVDFKQRLKMGLIVGQKQTGNIIDKDINRGKASISKQLEGSGLAEEFAKAMDKSNPNSEKAMASLAAKAASMGVQGTTISQMQKLASMKDNNNKGVLEQTTAQRGMGMLGRMEMLEKYSQSFTKGYSGLSEYVIKLLGVSEDEYKGLVDLRRSMDVHASSAATVGRTSSKSINDGLKNLLGVAPDDEEGFEKLMREMAKNDPKGLEEKIKIASTMQLEEAQEQAKKDEKAAATMEDFAQAQVKASLSLGDQIKNVLQVLLEKIFFVLDDILKAIGSIYDMLPSWISGDSKELNDTLGKWSTDAKSSLGSNNMRGVEYYQKTNKQILAARESNTTSHGMREKFSGLMASRLYTGVQRKPGESDDDFNKRQDSDEGNKRKALSNVMNGDDVEKFMIAMQNKDASTMNSMLNDLDLDKTAKLISSIAHQEASDMGGPREIEYATTHTDSGLKTKGQLSEARVQGDIDKRTTAKYQALDSKAVPTGEAAVGGGGGGGGGTTSTSLEEKNVEAVAKPAQETAASTAALVEKHAESSQKADKNYQTQSDMLSLLRSGIKLDNSWLSQNYKTVVREATLEAFRPALTEYLISYMRATNDPELAKAYSTDAIAGMDISALSQQKDAEELKRAITASPHAANGAGAVWADLRRESIVPNDQLRAMSSGGKNVSVGGITINVTGNGDPRAIKAAVLEAMDEIARRH